MKQMVKTWVVIVVKLIIAMAFTITTLTLIVLAKWLERVSQYE